MTDVAVIGFAQSPCLRRSDGTTSGVEMLVPIFQRGAAGHRAGQGRTSASGAPGSSDYLAGPGVLVRPGGGRDRGLPADHGVARGDGRRLGALRGLGEDPDRRGRHRAGLRVRQVVRGRPAPGAGPAARPVPAGAAVARLGEHRGAAGPARHRGRACGARRKWPRWPRAAAPRRSQPAGAGVRRGLRRGTARPALHRRPAPGARLRAGRRRRRGGDPGLRRPGPRAVRAAGLDHRVRAPDRLGVAGRARPDHGAVGGRRRARGRAPRRSRSPSCTRRSPTRRSCCAARSGWATGSGSTRRAARCAATRCSPPGLARIGMAAREIMSGRAGRALGHATSGPALQQNLVCVMEARQPRRGPVEQAPREAAGARAVLGVGQTRHRSRRTDVSIAGPVPRGGGPRARRRRGRPGRHRRRRGREGAGPVRGRDDARAVPGRRARRHRQAAAAGAHGGLGRRRDRRSSRPAWSRPGVHRRVLAVAFEKQSESNAMWALSITPPFSMPLLAGAGGYFAPHIRAYIRRSGAPEHIGAMVAVKDRRNGSLNPYAHLQQPDITLESVRASPMLWDPVRYDETCPSSDGACAVVIGDQAAAGPRGRGPAGGLDPGHRDAHRADHVRRQGPRQPAGRRRRPRPRCGGRRASPTRSRRSTSPRSTCRSPGSSRCGWRTSASPGRARAGG